MGGGSSSTSKADVVNSSVVNAMTRAIMRCRGNAMVRQNVTVLGDGNVTTVKQVQALKLSSTCGQDITSLNDIRQSVEAAIKQAASAQSDSVLGSLTNSAARDETFIKNEVEQNITAETITEVVNDINAVQELLVKGNRNITNVTQEQTMEIANDACNKVLSRMQSVQAVSTNASQTTDSSQTNVVEGVVKSVTDAVSNIFQSMTFVWIIVVIVVGYIVVQGGFLGTLLGGDSGQPGVPNPLALQMMQQRMRQMPPMGQMPPMQPMGQMPSMQPMGQMPPMQPMGQMPAVTLPPMPPMGQPPVLTPAEQVRADVGN